MVCDKVVFYNISSMFTAGKIYLHLEPEETQFSYSDNGDIYWKEHVHLLFYLLSTPH